ncbi:hypothetical protein [Streptantibioticus silvisoli]|uniref:Secreted protein n=1 Tax=Streptantibioticus silvisoli TaxID=2705255 RepID=A0ABT6W901_9ACTN|nr:hypothetical protein [Streptantibioticus silvisoli]MDI5966835.1 hypothetical protein [Streptantibioticus silvisoli]
MKRIVQGVATAAAAAAVLVLGQAPADAVNTYTIQPNSPKPAVCNNSGTVPAGTWIQNKICGYFIGTAMAGSSFDVSSTASDDYHWGRDHGDVNLCGWIPPAALSSSPTGTASDSCSTATQDAMSHRRSFGYNFNGAPHVVDGGTAITVDPANPSCGAYYNYYSASDFSSGSLRDYAGVPSSTVAYRFTTNGGTAMVVDDSTLGWVFMNLGCVTDWRSVAFNNDND